MHTTLGSFFEDLLYWYLGQEAKFFYFLSNLWHYSFGRQKATFWGQHILNNIVAHFGRFYCQNVFMKLKTLKAIFLGHFVVRDSGNNFGRFLVSFFEGWILYIWATFNYPMRIANFESQILDIQLQSVFFLVSQILCCI